MAIELSESIEAFMTRGKNKVIKTFSQHSLWRKKLFCN
jgi:hypothetical protein